MKKSIFYVLIALVSLCLASCGEEKPNTDGSAAVESSAGRTSCDYVQLWEDGPMWAMFNVGATITSYSKLQKGCEDATYEVYYRDFATYYNTANIGGQYAWGNPQSNGRVEEWSEHVRCDYDDIATELWGSNWRMPTASQLQTLCNSDYTTWTWCDGTTTQYVPGCTLEGYKISGVGLYSDKSIFLPNTGHYSPYFHDSGDCGEYWTDTRNSYGEYVYLRFKPAKDGELYCSNRIFGHAVRAVLSEEGEMLAKNNSIESTASDEIMMEMTDQDLGSVEVEIPDSLEMVDLGLSVKWANMNVGAYSPEESGLYFAWGETEGYTSDTQDGRVFDWEDYKWCKGSENTMTKYCHMSDLGYNGFTDDKMVLDATDDAATVNWGENWRMPTRDEWDELLENCTWAWTTVNGVDGYRVTANNGNSIFLPAAGYRYARSLYDVGESGEYWSSSFYKDSHYALGEEFNSHNKDFVSINCREKGVPIRPVCN